MSPYYDKARITIHCGDAFGVLPELEFESVDAVVTDPPYGLEFMGKAWDSFRSISEWHHRWATEVLRVAKPGTFLLAFGGTRTFHRLTCAIEDAGWEIRDCIMWVYGSGFPKSHDISKAIDKAAGADRERYERYERPAFGDKFSDDNGSTYGTVLSAEPVTENAKRWHGWGTALKPAWEPIVVAMKPLDGTFAENAMKHGVAGLNIDGCRVEYQDGDDGYEKGVARAASPRADIRGGNFHHGEWGEKKHIVQSGMTPDGRWPANLIHDGSDEVLECFPETESGTFSGHMNQPKSKNTFGEYALQDESGHVGDCGSAARFFYCAKAGKDDRGSGLGVKNNHPTVKPTALMRYLVRLVTPPGGTVLDPFLGSETTTYAARAEHFACIGIEQSEAYCKIAAERLKQSVLAFEE